MNIGFFVRHFTERGSEVATFDYAKYNETCLHNKSYIICFTPSEQKRIMLPQEQVRYTYDKFKASFSIIEIDNMNEMKNVIKDYNLSFFYTLTHGGCNDIYHFYNKNIWGFCKTIKHCVFDTSYPVGDFYISIGESLNQKYSTNIPVIPHIVNLPECHENLRKELGIPEYAIVLGRYGGKTEFNIQLTHDAIKEYVQENNDVYFLFMNTMPFFHHPNIIYLERNVDLEYKVKFINTCDAMIHARLEGETFGLSIAEFSSKNKPIVTCDVGDNEHIRILGEKAMVYHSKTELLAIFKNIKTVIGSKKDWNAYKLYTPEYVMNMFKDMIFDTI